MGCRIEILWEYGGSLCSVAGNRYLLFQLLLRLSWIGHWIIDVTSLY